MTPAERRSRRGRETGTGQGLVRTAGWRDAGHDLVVMLTAAGRVQPETPMRAHPPQRSRTSGWTVPSAELGLHVSGCTAEATVRARHPQLPRLAVRDQSIAHELSLT